MTTSRTNIGRIPIIKGAWSASTTYKKTNQVTRYGSTYQSAIEGNLNNSPCELVDGVATHQNTDKWYVIADGSAAYTAGTRITNVEILAEKNSQDLSAINVDNLGDAKTKSIDMDELPKICSFPMYIISTTAPNVSPDFISQHWIDTVSKKVYIAVGVSSAADFVVLN